MVFRKQTAENKPLPSLPQKKIEEVPVENLEEEHLTEIVQPPKQKQEEPITDNNVWRIENVATETEPVIYNSETEETLNIMQALVLILNRTEE